MSPYEMDKYRNDFVTAAEKLGWTKRSVAVYHTRQDISLEESMYYSNDEFLFSEENLSEGMIKEIIKMAGKLP